MAAMKTTILRVALVALGMLMVPLVTSQLVEGWNWPPRAFVLAYALFFGVCMAYALISRRMDGLAYKAGVGLSLAAGFGLGWSNMVHVSGTDNPANLTYFLVLVVGLVGAVLVRLQPRGLAWTLFAMALLMGLISVSVPSGAAPDAARRMAIGHAVLVVLFTVAGLLFRQASMVALRRPAQSA